MKYYAGIGNREISKDVEFLIYQLASVLEEDGWILRSGGAEGADKAFESGVKDSKNKEIYRPEDVTKEAESIAASFHPAWDKCSEYAKKLHTRNVFQILGKNLKSSSMFVVSYTRDGCEDGRKTTRDTGGTGQALRIASAYNIPIFNLSRKNAMDRLAFFISML